MSDMDERLKRLISRREGAAEERQKLLDTRKAITTIAEEEGRQDLSDEEDQEFRRLTEKVKLTDSTIRGYDDRIKELSEELDRAREISDGANALRKAQARALEGITESRTYEAGNGRSYLQDLMRVSLNYDDTGDSRGRLMRHGAEVQTEREYRDLSRVDGAGGFVTVAAAAA